MRVSEIIHLKFQSQIQTVSHSTGQFLKKDFSHLTLLFVPCVHIGSVTL